jgi:hypothetical protein
MTPAANAMVASLELSHPYRPSMTSTGTSIVPTPYLNPLWQMLQHNLGATLAWLYDNDHVA